MRRLVYGVDRELRDGERVLAGFREHGPYGCIVAGEAEYEIAHRGKTGWHFRLIDAGGESVCEYDPFPVVRGGRLRGRWSVVSIRGAPLRPRRWSFSGDPGWRMRVEVLRAVGLRPVGEGRVASVSPYEVQLDGEVPMISLEVSMQLAFGCWILVERQSLVLPDAGGGG